MVVEKALLGTLIKAGYLIGDTIIRPEQLEDTRNQILLEEMMQMHHEGKKVDLITLTTSKKLDEIGGVSHLNELLAHANVDKFEEIESLVIESWKEREKKNILLKASSEDWGIDKVVTQLNSINEVKVDDHSTIVDALVELYEAPWQEKPIQKGATTGISKLNTMTNGWQNGEVVIIAARPSMGKTDVMLHFAKQVGWAGYLPIIFSLEMPTKSITTRLIASTGNISRTKMRNPKRDLTPAQKEAWSDVLAAVERTKIQIFDAAGQTVVEMRAKTRKMMNQFPNRKPVIFIDYLTLIKPSQFYGGNAHLQVTEISRDLKKMAKEFDCPVICLAQLNRSVESRQDKRPMMSDIRESGSVEQDADVIMFLYREKYYNKETDDDTLEMIVAKNRNGPVGTVRTIYREGTGVIEDVLD